MGQKVCPTGIRIGKGLPGSFSSVFFADKNYADLLVQDYQVRKWIKNEYAKAQISKVFIERCGKNCVITIHAGKPKLIIGDSGSFEEMASKLTKMLGIPVRINVSYVSKPNLESSIVAYNIAKQIENYTPFRLALKKAIEETMRQNAKGVKVSCSGRLGGAEIARTESYKVGRVPLHTLRADIDYAQYNAKTKYGIIGIKVWIYREGLSLGKKVNI